MTTDDGAEFFSRLNALADFFNAKLSEAVATMYFDALADIPMERLIPALNRATKDCTFMPKPVEIRSFASGNVDDHAQIEWNAWRRAASLGGAAATLVCSNHLADALTWTFGGWVDACVMELSPEMWASKRKEFLVNYRISFGRYEHSRECLPGTMEPNQWTPVVFIANDGDVRRISAETARGLLGGDDGSNRRITS